MKKLNTKFEIIEALSQEKLLPSDSLSTDYGNLYWECAKGGKHLVNDDMLSHSYTGADVVFCARPTKFLLTCNHSLVTLVRIEGILSQTCISEWYFEYKELNKQSTK